MYLFMHVILVIFLLGVIGFLGYMTYKNIKHRIDTDEFDEEWNRTLEEMNDCEEGDPDDPFHDSRG